MGVCSTQISRTECTVTMDKLTKTLLGRYNCTVHLRSEISHEAVLAAREHIDLETHIKRTMAVDLSHKLLTSKATVFHESREPGENIVFSARIIAMSEEEVESLVNAAYQAGLDSKNA